MTRIARAVFASLSLVIAACATVAGGVDDRAALEAALRARSRAIVEAEQRQDLDAIMPNYATDAVMHVEGAPPVRGHDAIRQLYREFFQTPIASFDASITSIEIAESGDLAYETGVNDLVLDQGGQRVPLRGKYLAVWRRGDDSVWRIVALAVTNDRPPTR